MTRRTPPLNALRAFEAAARLGSFAAAAEELNVSRGAVSRHVANLEAHLGLPLFARHAQGVELSERGRRYAERLGRAFDEIARASSAAAAPRDELRIICPPTTSIRWLIPRLPDFKARHPDIRIRLTTDFYGPRGFDADEFDLGFSIMTLPGGRTPGVEARRLMPHRMTPAHAPGYVPPGGPPTRPADLARCRLLGLAAGVDGWQAWGEAFGAPGLETRLGDTFANLDIAVKAALMGQGVVMTDLVLCADEIAGGGLIAPFPDCVCTPAQGDYALVTLHDRWTDPRVNAFVTWAIEQARASEMPA